MLERKHNSPREKLKPVETRPAVKTVKATLLQQGKSLEKDESLKD